MPRIHRDSLLTLEAYARERAGFRARVLEHKRFRSVPLGQSITLLFEDELTMRYQVQEMLRIERIFEAQGIQDELDTYNAMVPDGHNLKATMMIEYPDPEERKRWLARLIGVERRVWMQVAGHPRVWAIADEDLDREDAGKTSSVHFLRFEFDESMRRGLKNGCGMSAGIDHDSYRAALELPPDVCSALVADFD